MVVEAKAIWRFEPSDKEGYFNEDLVKKQPETVRTILHADFPVYGQFLSSRIPPSQADNYDQTQITDKPVQPLNEYMFPAKMMFTEGEVRVNQRVSIKGKTEIVEKPAITILVHSLPYDTGKIDSYYVPIIVSVGKNEYYGKARYYSPEKTSQLPQKVVGPVL